MSKDCEHERNLVKKNEVVSYSNPYGSLESMEVRLTEHEVVPKNLKIIHDATNRRVPTDKFEIYE